MCLRNIVFACSLLFSSNAVHAQVLSDTTSIPLTVEQGFPLQVALTRKVEFKENAAVRGKIVEPVYAFDREVIPPGTEILGKVESFRKAGKWKRALNMLRGDFTPLREPEITFDTLVFPDGTRFAIQTAVSTGAEKLITFDGFKAPLSFTIKEPEKDRLKNFLWSLSPYRPQYLHIGTRLKATLMAPLTFGNAVFTRDELRAIGSQPPAGTIISARLISSLDSAANRPGDDIEAVLKAPLFSAGHRLIFPAGSRLRGEVVTGQAAERWHRNGKMVFTFTTIQAPVLPGVVAESAPQNIDGRLAGVQVPRALDDVHIDAQGATRISESKKRFLSPAYALVKTGRAFDDTADPLGRAVASAYGGKITKEVVSSGSGLGITASITGGMVPPVGIGMKIYSAARSVHSNFIGRGQDVRLPADTPIQIRLQE